MLIRDRIRELRRVPARLLCPHPKNWRKHPLAQQNALRGVLAEIGYADALLARELPDGSLQLIDGHLRAETTPDMQVPVLLLDLNDAEAEKLLALLDPLTNLAETDPLLLGDLVARVETDSAAVRELLDNLVAQQFEREAPTEAAEKADVDIPELYQLVVACDDEADQRQLFERLRREGYSCRVLSL